VDQAVHPSLRVTAAQNDRQLRSQLTDNSRRIPYVE
jgi:hypothetical protein